MRRTRALATLFMVLTFAMGAMLITSCDKDNPSTIQPPMFSLDIYYHIGSDPEIYLNNSSKIAGMLMDSNFGKLDARKIHFDVEPPEIGYITPIGHAYTDVTDSTGFRENVLFTGRNVGIATIYARYYHNDNYDVLSAQDTLRIQVKQRGNE